MFFAQKYKVEPKKYYEKKWNLEKGESNVVFADVSLKKSSGSKAETDEAEVRSYLQGLQGFKGIDILQPVVDTIETIAPGLLDEHTYLYQVFCKLQDKTETLVNKVDKLQKKISDLQETINQLGESITILQEENAALRQQLHDIKTVTAAPSPPVQPAVDAAPPAESAVPADNRLETNGGAESVVPTDQVAGNNTAAEVIPTEEDIVHTTESTALPAQGAENTEATH
jgi:FtsZ-binding cell division protein ZapB